MARKPVTPKLRFEVFKRDNFICQYCGRKAPDVVLHVDHIEPIAEGGDNDIMNLITACSVCNAGKGPRPLSDASALERQRAQLEELQDRREQVELMARWRKELQGLESDQEDNAADLWSALLRGHSSLTESGHQSLRRLARQFSWGEVVDAIPIAIDQYVRWKGDHPDSNTVEFAWSKIGGICHNRKREAKDPGLSYLNRIRALWRSRRGEDKWYVMPLLQEAVRCGWEPQELHEFALRTWRWSDFEYELECFIEESGGTPPR